MTPFYFGIDVSKGYADFIIINSQKQQMLENFQLDDTFKGHQALFNILNDFLKEHTGSTLYIGMESTGGYENNCVYNTGVRSLIDVPDLITSILVYEDRP